MQIFWGFNVHKMCEYDNKCGKIKTGRNLFLQPLERLKLNWNDLNKPFHDEKGWKEREKWMTKEEKKMNQREIMLFSF